MKPIKLFYRDFTLGNIMWIEHSVNGGSLEITSLLKNYAILNLSWILGWGQFSFFLINEIYLIYLRKLSFFKILLIDWLSEIS